MSWLQFDWRENSDQAKAFDGSTIPRLFSGLTSWAAGGSTSGTLVQLWVVGVMLELSK